MFGKPTGEKRVPGPFVDPGVSPTRRVDPRATAPATMTPAKENP
jgi:hypothetical protein